MMKEFFDNLISTWWGILIICIVCVAVWVLLSALLYRQFFKRFYDIVLSGMAIIVFSPLFLLLIIVGAIKMKGNPFFTQLRPGRRKKLSKKQCEKQGVPYGTYGEEKIFKLIKFRTMTFEKDESGELLPDIQRLNKYGKILRSTSLDELPELFHIFVGHMSIVGPRPLLVKYLPLYNEEQRHRHDVRPGLTGLAQVHGRNEVSWESRFIMDVSYVQHISLFCDIKILIDTMLVVLKREGVDSSKVKTVTMLEFTGTAPQTPYFVILEEILKNNILSFKSALQNIWGNSQLAYSVKTNSLPWLLKYLHENNVLAEVVSDEEFALAKMCGYKENEIIFNGPIKGKDCFIKAAKGGAIINIDILLLPDLCLFLFILCKCI